MPTTSLHTAFVASVAFAVLANGARAHADEIGLETGVYDWPEEVPYTLTLQRPSGNPRHLLYHIFHPTEDPLATKLYPDLSMGNRSATERSMALNTRSSLSVGATDPFRAYREPILMEKVGEQFEILNRRRILALRTLTAIPDDAISWPFEDGAVFHPGDEPELPLLTEDLDESTGVGDLWRGGWKQRFEQQIKIVRLGRRMPGGAIELDQPYLFDRNSGVPRLVSADRPARRSHGHATPVRPPMDIGNYEIRVTGLGGAIMARHSFSVRYPRLDGALSLDPSTNDSHDAPPRIVVTLPHALHASRQALALRVKVQRILGNETYERVDFIGGSIAGYPDYDPGNAKTVFQQRGGWKPGAYRALLYWRDGALADELHFEIGGANDQDPYRLVTLKPDLTTDDVAVKLDSYKVQVRGPHIRFSVADTEKQQPLDTGPLVGELYRLGYYSYDCQWYEGYYTGGSALISRNGIGQIPSPIEAGRYELRVFRPMVSYLDAGAREAEPGATVATEDTSETLNMQLIGTTRFTARAPRYDHIIEVEAFEPGDMGRTINVSIQSPGREVEGHALRLEAWHGAERVPGGFVRNPYFDTRDAYKDKRSGIALDDGRNGAHSLVIDRFPFAATILPIKTPGNYELRIFDETTGLYIARRHLAFRDPGPPDLPDRAAYGSQLAGDWPAEGDPQRGVAAWYKLRSECADPEFDSPPTLEIVEYVVTDADERGNGEFRVVDNVLADNPYFVRATFDEAPPDDEYQVRLDGERRITIFRTPDDPRVYRSAVLHFGELHYWEQTNE